MINSQVLSFPVRLQFQISRSRAPVPPSQILVSSWETSNIKLIYLLELIDFTPQSLAALGQSSWSPTFWWCFAVGMQCGNFGDCIRLDSLLKGKLWIPADHPRWSGERTETQKGRQDTQNSRSLFCGLFRLLCNSVFWLYPLDIN